MQAKLVLPPWVPYLLLTLIAMARLIHLDADPGLIKSLLNNANDVGDEAYWSAAARNLILFGTAAADDYFQGATSPFYTILSYISYWLFDVSLSTTRLPNALLGIAAVVLAYRLIEPYSRSAAFLAGLTLALENNFFIHTRMGQVEAACSVFALLSFSLLIRSKVPILAGVAFGLSIATKIVALLLAPAFFLFFLFQSVRGVTSWKDMIKFCAGLAVIGVALIMFVVSFHGGFGTVNEMALLQNPVRVVFDFITGFQELNPTHYEGDIVLKNVILQSQGAAIMRNPARVAIDFITGFYLSYPTIVLLLLLLGGYAWKARLPLWIGKGARERLRQVTDIEIMVIAWLVGLTVGMLFLSDMHHRRMNLFTIPLALVPGLLMLRQGEEVNESPKGVQTLLLCAPIIYTGMLFGRKALQMLTGLSTGWSLLIASSLMVMGTSAALALVSRRSASWWRYVGWVTLIAWIILVSLSFGYSLPSRILPNLEITNQAIQITLVIGFLSAMVVLGILSTKKAPLVIAVTLLLTTSLDLYDIIGSSFSSRDASLRLRTMTSPGDWVIGDGAHVLSPNASYYPVQAYPKRGINRDFIKRVKPQFLFQIVDGKDRVKLLSHPSQTEFSVKESDFYAIGASRIEPIADFPLYPVLRQPAEMTYRLSRVFY